MGKRKEHDRPPLPVVRVAPLGELKIYEVSEHELEQMKAGSAVGDLLNIGNLCLSVAATLLATLLSTNLPDRHFYVFVCALLIFSLVGAICDFIGWQSRRSVAALVDQIKSRMPPPPAIQQTIGVTTGIVSGEAFGIPTITQEPRQETPPPSPGE